MLESVLASHRQRAETALERRLPRPDIIPARLHEAMRYATLGGGKRVRALLVYAAGAAVKVPVERLDGPASAVEMIHAYSLIHDDLPAMDDDDLRRGRPSCHRAFDEATAILAGDALQALAFQTLAADPSMEAAPATRLALIETLSRAAGSRGMVGGQAIDLAAVGRDLNLAELESMHIHKTGALIRACVRLGALSQPAISQGVLSGLDRYAKCIGLAFQIHDDILDVVGDTATLGKTQGTDSARDKPTYPALMGLDGAHSHAQALYQEALEALAEVDHDTATLRGIAAFIVQRRN